MDAKALTDAIVGRHVNDIKAVLSGLTDAESGIFFRGVLAGAYWSGYERGMGTAVGAIGKVSQSPTAKQP